MGNSDGQTDEWRDKTEYVRKKVKDCVSDERNIRIDKYIK